MLISNGGVFRDKPFVYIVVKYDLTLGKNPLFTPTFQQPILPSNKTSAIG